MKIKIKDFSLRHTLESGQCFEWFKYKDGYGGVIDDTFYYIYQDNDVLNVLPYSKNFHGESYYKEIISKYFNLDIDYDSILKKISIDNHVKNAVNKYHGIRIVNQPHFECLLSFMLSANNTVTNIQRSRKLISENFGELVFRDKDTNEKYYSLPKIAKAKKIEINDFLLCKTGFRGKFIHAAIKSLDDKEINNIEKMTYDEAKNNLLQIKGIGEKIADCILLYSYEFYNAYPTDTWVKKITKNLYFKDRDVKEKDMREFGMNYFNGFAGWAQLFLYIFYRESKSL